MCSFHHDLLHHGGYKIRLGPSSGRIEWQPPPWINLDGEWKSNPIATARDPYAQAHSHTAHAQARDAHAHACDADAKPRDVEGQIRDPQTRDWGAQTRDSPAHRGWAGDADGQTRDGPDP